MKWNKWLSRTVDEIVEDLPVGEKIIVKRLRLLILECLPSATEENSYGAPFYNHNRMICFIWPPSLQWGPKKESRSNKGIALGFCQGDLMSNEDGTLLAEGRKKVFCLYIHILKDINENQIRSLLYEADLIDQSFNKRKNKQKRIN